MCARLSHKHTHTRLGFDHHHIVPVHFISLLRGHSLWFTSAGSHHHPPTPTHTSINLLLPAQTGPVDYPNHRLTVHPVASRSLSSRQPSERHQSSTHPPTHPLHPPAKHKHDGRCMWETHHVSSIRHRPRHSCRARHVSRGGLEGLPRQPDVVRAVRGHAVPRGLVRRRGSEEDPRDGRHAQQLRLR